MPIAAALRQGWAGVGVSASSATRSSRPASPTADGRRVGVPWLGFTCGECAFCRSGRENLCEFAQFTGCDRDGGMAEYCIADARFCFPLPGDYPDLQAAPLLCAGLIGCRALRMCGDVARLGLYGFGAAAHILCQTVRSVANLTRRDAQEFLALAPRVPVRTHVTSYPLESANEALDDLRHGRFTGAAALMIAPTSG